MSTPRRWWLAAVILSAALVALVTRLAPLLRSPPRPPVEAQAGTDHGALRDAPTAPANVAEAPKPTAFVGLDPCSAIDQPAATAELVEGRLAAVATRLQAQGSPRERAVGLYLEAFSNGASSWSRFLARDPGCAEHAACQSEADRVADESKRGPRDALVRLAAASGEPGVYEAALLACRNGVAAPDGPCGALSLAQWARLDPDNATPWLELAADADRRGDTIARDDAFFRASRATRFSGPRNAFDAVLQAAAMDAEVDTTRDAIAVYLVGIWAALPMSWWGPLQSFCSVEAIHDSSVRQVCGDVAQMLAEHGEELLDLGAASRIGERIGWTPERLSALRERREALARIAGDEAPTPSPTALDCDALHRAGTWGRDMFRLGEVAFLEQKLAASNLTAARYLARPSRPR